MSLSFLIILITCNPCNWFFGLGGSIDSQRHGFIRKHGNQRNVCVDHGSQKADAGKQNIGGFLLPLIMDMRARLTNMKNPRIGGIT